MQTEVRTIADLQKLPARLQRALQSARPQTHRYLTNIARAERKTLIQGAVVEAIQDQAISYGLGVEILVRNSAYGFEGKAALKAVRP